MRTSSVNQVKESYRRSHCKLRFNLSLKLAYWRYYALCLLLLLCFYQSGQAALPWSSDYRTDQLLDSDWLTAADTTGSSAFQDFQNLTYKASATSGWKAVNLPHNWDDYGGYIRKKHGNRHGDCWYRKTFDAKCQTGKTSFLFFEGVSSYATVYLNGHLVGRHSGGRTSFTLEVSAYLNKNGRDNLLAVKVAHPANIRDLPWVCGGYSDEVGFSEGSQPMGIFRPVHLIQTGKVRIIPFGVHIYNDTTVNENEAILQVETTLKSYAQPGKQVTIRQQLIDKAGSEVARFSQSTTIGSNDKQLHCQLQLTGNVHLWSLQSPYLYQLKTTVLDKHSGDVLDELTTPYGIRWIKWPDLHNPVPKQFLLNGKPVFINGIAGYEHALGKSHAFTAQEIATRVAMIRSMGFNGFRDAHQPHNLRYEYYWDQLGVLWWPQFSAHIWFDTPAFRQNFLRLLKDWVLERRNSPANIMWGLQNESRLPADFARQCVALIRSLDPTASSQRLITTCNGGQGTDWDVPQNWSGTYGGDPNTYDKDLKKEVLVGEYGGWRTMDLHSEGGFDAKGPYSIDSWCALLEKKIWLANKVRDSVAGQFLWLFNSHDNPGREQAAEGYRDLDRIGPVNYKGVLTSWEEPTEAYYLYQSNFTSADTAPMVHIADHEWVGRWKNPTEKKDIIIYSNCDSVVLYNGIHQRSLGSRSRRGIGTHFTWSQVQLHYNVLYAVGYYNGRAVVSDRIRLRNLPVAPQLQENRKKASGALDQNQTPEQNQHQNLDLNTASDNRISDHEDMNTHQDVLYPKAGYHYLYRYNAGGPSYKDHYGNLWSADRNLTPGQTANEYGSLSWTAAYKGLPAYFASQRYITDPVKGNFDEALFQTFRYGRDQLKFIFPVENGDYLVQLFFVEPWWGIGSHENCSGWRDFDVAINGKIMLHHLDIFKEAGSLNALRKELHVQVQNGQIVINFPETYSGQAVVSGIAIAQKIKTSENDAIDLKTAPGSQPSAIFAPTQNHGDNSHFQVKDWLSLGDSTTVYLKKSGGKNSAVKVHFNHLPPALFGAEWLGHKTTGKQPSVKKAHLLDSPSDNHTPIYWEAKEPLQLYIATPWQDTVLLRQLKAAGYIDTDSKIFLIKKVGIAEKLDSLLVLKKELKAMQKIQQTAWWNSCLMAFKPVSLMQPPYDQKPDLTFGINATRYNTGTQKTKRADKDCLVYKVQQTKPAEMKRAFCSWDILTGVADFHSFQLKYAYEGLDSLPAKLTLLAADGKVMASANIWLTHTRENKWNSSYLLTPTMINAGRYTLRISWQRPIKQALFIYSLKMR
ncbi:hypothetical protein GCM10027566_17000 [Arachidicoccus ginsenosidivorans]|uniref:DUF4982 domain-containing protein n=1 Tax=Arachidicoccus ginsenosidivorans TaxID=496057 RepID=A0A5B8VH71_9BACT|nr:DUF4982 domain-containing protein [Arachidicoccus ginsenosidivorans]